VLRTVLTVSVNPVAASSSSRDADLRATPSDMVSALNHPVRRSSLRLLYEIGPASARQVARRISYASANNVRSHLDTLVNRGVARKDREAGSKESVYSPLEKSPIGWVATVLMLTAEED